MASNPPIFGHSSTKPIPQSFCNPQNHPTMDEVGPMKPSNPGENVSSAPATPPSQWQTSLINLSFSLQLWPTHRADANQPQQEFIMKGLGHL